MEVLEKSTSGKFLISCVFFEASTLAQKIQGGITMNCGSCITWNGSKCNQESKLRRHYSIT
jgi:hypothetical protein